MVYLLAAVGLITIAVLLWQAFGPARDALARNLRSDGDGSEGSGPRSRPARPIAPDDDPEFLRRLSEQQRKPDDE